MAALRSPAFACSDPELLDFVGQGGRFNYLSPGNAAEGMVSECLRSLRKYHQDRLWSSIANLVEGFLRERLLMEAALDHPRTREQWRRYRFMVEQARAFAGAGGNSLRTFLRWVDTQTEEKARVTEVPVPEGDEESVRVMTVHAAKGLEFPVVVLTGLNAESSLPVDRVLFDRRSGGAELRVGPTGSAFETDGYEGLSQRERQMADAEYVRLLYVAATRARDHLVLSMYRRSGDEKSAAFTIDRFLVGEEQLWEQLSEVPWKLPEVSAPSQPTEAPEGHTLESRDNWVHMRQETLKKQSRAVSVGATTLAQIAKEESGTEEPWRRGRGGTSLGRAVHAVLQTVVLATGGGLAETARAQATAEGLPHREDEVLALARVALESQVVKRAVASGKLWREVPVAALMEGGVVEGFIDLLFEEEDGLVVVDYKTDALEADQTADAVDRYRIQGGAYALALQQVTGKPVKEVVFLFLQPRREEIVRDVANLQAEADLATTAFFAD